MIIAIFLEGRTDREVVSNLISKINAERTTPIRVVYRPLGSRSAVLNTGKIASHVRFELIQRGVGAVIACLDMNCNDSGQLMLEREMAERELKAEGLPIPVKYHFVKYEIETWLASDQSAWQAVFPRLSDPAFPPSVLEDCSPKDCIRSYLRSRGVDFRYTLHDVRIAERLNLRKCRRTCSNLNEFVELLCELAG